MGAFDGVSGASIHVTTDGLLFAHFLSFCSCFSASHFTAFHDTHGMYVLFLSFGIVYVHDT